MKVKFVLMVKCHTRRYYNNENANNESFIFKNGKRYYKTSDTGKKIDNILFYEGEE